MGRMPQLLAFSAGVGILGGCPAPKEAMDPREIMGEEMSHGGADARAGGDPDTARKPAKTQPKADPMDAPASRDECRRAASNLEKLALAVAIAEETDPEVRGRLDAWSTPPATASAALSPAERPRASPG
jgi:hypothetical protein